ncbi:hypothetical protein VPH35_019781 [Triticum aestivum]
MRRANPSPSSSHGGDTNVNGRRIQGNFCYVMAVNDVRKKKVPQRKQRTMKRHTTFSYEDLLDEIVWEILIRLPVESLVRFKLVSKAWRSIISDPVFVRAHLRYSKQKHHNPLSFLIIPEIYLEPDPSNIISTNIRLYHLVQLQHSFTGSTSRQASLGWCPKWHTAMAWCCYPPTPTPTSFNPTMRDVVELPKSHRNMLQHSTCLPIGFGLDASTGRYKVVRSFYYSIDCHHIAMGMEVFIINDGQDRSWRETLTDPPALISCPQTAIHCKGVYSISLIEKSTAAPRGCYSVSALGTKHLLLLHCFLICTLKLKMKILLSMSSMGNYALPSFRRCGGKS